MSWAGCALTPHEARESLSQFTNCCMSLLTTRYADRLTAALGVPTRSASVWRVGLGEGETAGSEGDSDDWAAVLGGADPPVGEAVADDGVDVTELAHAAATREAATSSASHRRPPGAQSQLDRRIMTSPDRGWGVNVGCAAIGVKGHTSPPASKREPGHG